MAERWDPVAASPTPAYLLAAALHLQQAATRAVRLGRDVAAKTDEIVKLLTDADNPLDGNRRQESTDAGTAILKILDGLGL
jgi:hypothetical protein